jgi:hypothetical protein
MPGDKWKVGKLFLEAGRRLYIRNEGGSKNELLHVLKGRRCSCDLVLSGMAVPLYLYQVIHQGTLIEPARTRAHTD